MEKIIAMLIIELSMNPVGENVSASKDVTKIKSRIESGARWRNTMT